MAAAEAQTLQQHKGPKAACSSVVFAIGGGGDGCARSCRRCCFRNHRRGRHLSSRCGWGWGGGTGSSGRIFVFGSSSSLRFACCKKSYKHTSANDALTAAPRTPGHCLRIAAAQLVGGGVGGGSLGACVGLRGALRSAAALLGGSSRSN